MTFDTSPIRSAHNFRMTFIQLRHTSHITRMQLIFMCYLIESGHIKNFLCSKVTPAGITWGGTNQYLRSLKRIGYTIKQGRLWTITPAGMKYHSTFMERFNRTHRGVFLWK
jgi:hypothetical protein